MATRIKAECPNCHIEIDVLGVDAETYIGCSHTVQNIRLARRFLPSRVVARCTGCSTLTPFVMTETGFDYIPE